MRSLVYLFPSNFDHPGLRIKAEGQLGAFSTKYSVKLVHFPFQSQDSILRKVSGYVWFHLQSVVSCLSSDVVYFRYNAKFPILVLFLYVLSFFKSVYIEYNGMYDHELRFLKRYFEYVVHQINTFFLKRSRCRHLVIRNAIRDHFIHLGFPSARVIRFSNGYSPVKKMAAPALADKVRGLKSGFIKVALFVSSGQVWVDLGVLYKHIAPFPDLLVLLVGPYDATQISHPQVAVLGSLSPGEIQEISDLCDFGIGHLNWDVMGGKEGSHLKTVEYLCNGLPVLINYYDYVAEITEIRPYIFNLQEDEKALAKLYQFSYEPYELKCLARELLSWETVLLPLITG